ncbi:hypothetical protein AGMMS50268_36970 [Spirochaetia bacterium]|nr:hypothetical protein AGMMS50268_36970 [Spirochaetia bacterium]
MDQTVQTELDMLKNIIINTVPVEQIFLFGSYAYGTPNRDSDLDLYIVLKDDPQIREIDAGVQIQLAIGRKKSMPVDIIVNKKSTYLKRKQAPTIERKIAREGIRVYG